MPLHVRFLAPPRWYGFLLMRGFPFSFLSPVPVIRSPACPACATIKRVLRGAAKLPLRRATNDTALFPVDRRIYVVEQLPSAEPWSALWDAHAQPFNRGWLLNQGFLAAEGEADYVALHDVDMLPVGVNYSYPPHRFAHLAAQASQFRDGSGSDGNTNGARQSSPR